MENDDQAIADWDIPEGKSEIVHPDLTRMSVGEFEDDLPKVPYLFN